MSESYNFNKILKNLNILYIEDEKNIRLNIKKTLELFCENVFDAENILNAKEILTKQRIDIIISDINLPDMSGIDFVKEIRIKDKTIPIILLSAYTDKEKLLNAIELNLIKYIEKPILYDDLIKVFENIIKYMEENNLLQIKLDKNIYYSFVDKNIIKNGEKITLTKNEVLFLELLLEKPNHLISKNIIENSVFKASVDENTLRNMVYRLRKKIDTDTIATIKDLGYIIKIK